MLRFLADASKLIDRYCFKCDLPIKCEKLKRDINCQNCSTRLLYRCLKCKREFDDIRYTLKHVRSPVCEPGKPLHCFVCDHSASTKNLLDHHLKAMHSHIDMANIRECSKCRKTFKSLDSLREHLYKCGKEPQLFCDICSYKTQYKSNLGKHIQSHVSRNHIFNEGSNTDGKNAKSKKLHSEKTLTIIKLRII